MRELTIQHKEEHKERVDDWEIFEEGSCPHEHKCCKLDYGKIAEQQLTYAIFHRLLEEEIGYLDDYCVVA